MNGQMGMYELLKNDWMQPEPWRLSAAAQEKQPEPSAEAAKARTCEKRKRLPLQNRQKFLTRNLLAAPESDRFDQLEQMVNHKSVQSQQPAPCSQADKAGGGGDTRPPRSRLKRILDFFKLRR